jgi:hypothetical protein
LYGCTPRGPAARRPVLLRAGLYCCTQVLAGFGTRRPGSGRAGRLRDAAFEERVSAVPPVTRRGPAARRRFRLHDSAVRLHDGAVRLHDGAVRLRAGTRVLHAAASGARKRPPAASKRSPMRAARYGCTQAPSRRAFQPLAL